MTMASKLEFSTPSDEPTIQFRRFFRAPPARVFEVWTSPVHLRNWWGPRVLELTICEVDLHVGGKYRYVLRTPDGQEFTQLGEYGEIDPPNRLVSTYALDVAPEHQTTETVIFSAVDGGTLVTSTSVHLSIEARDRQIAGGMMEAGLTDQFFRLDDLLAAIPGYS